MKQLDDGSTLQCSAWKQKVKQVAVSRRDKGFPEPIGASSSTRSAATLIGKSDWFIGQAVICVINDTRIYSNRKNRKFPATGGGTEKKRSAP